MMLTVPKLESLKSKEKSYQLKDSDNLFMRISPKGVKTWFCRFTFAGKDKSVDLGRYPNVTSGDARNKRDKIVNDAKQGLDATFLKRKKKLTEQKSIILKDMNAMLDEFIQRDILKNRLRPEQPIRVIDRDIRPVIGKYPIDEVTRFEINIVLDKVADRGANVMANRLATLLGQIFKYANARGYIKDNPTIGLEKRSIGGKEKTRERTLTWTEISTLLQHLPEAKTHPVYSSAMKLALASGQRISVICQIKLEEIDSEKQLLFIPKSDSIRKTKSTRNRVLPLSTYMINIIKDMSQYNHNSEFLFPRVNESNEPIDKDTVMSALRRNAKLLGCPESKEERYTLHDLRRTFSTLASSLVLNGRIADPYVVELILGHTLKVSATSDIYNRNEYLEQQREVIEVWGERLTVLSTKKSNVEVLEVITNHGN